MKTQLKVLQLGERNHIKKAMKPITTAKASVHVYCCWFIAALTVPCLFLVGCASQSRVAKGPMFDASARATYMILPFGDANEPRYRGQFPNAASVVRDAFETAFLVQGFKTISCPEAHASDAIHGVTRTANVDLATETNNAGLIRQHLKAELQAQFGEQGITEEDAIDSGKRHGADFLSSSAL